MEKLYEYENIKADCKTTEEYIDSYKQPNKPPFHKDDSGISCLCGLLSHVLEKAMFNLLRPQKYLSEKSYTRTMCGKFWV